jgi:hypothetical protein
MTAFTMPFSMNTRPLADELLELHDQLCAGSPTAPADIAERVYGLLQARLRKSIPFADSTEIADCVADVLLRYFREPSRFKRNRGTSLVSFLLMDARGDVLNALDHRRRRRDTARLPEEVANMVEDRNIAVMTRERSLEVLPAELDARVTAALPDDADRRILSMMMDGVRATEAYAVILGLSGLPRESRALAVKRVKDRIRATLKRKGIVDAR